MNKVLSGSAVSKAKTRSKPKTKETALPKATPKATAKTAPKTTEGRGRKPKAQKTTDLLPGKPRTTVIRMRSEPPPGPIGADDALVERWAQKGAELLQALEAHDAHNHEYRVDLKDGRFVWVDPDGRVSAEAHARAICSYAPATSSLTMAWLDPLLASSSVPRVDRMASEYDDVDEEGAWRIAIAAAAAVNADYLYRVAAPNVWYFLTLTNLSFQPIRASFTPSTPAGLVLSELGECRTSLRTRAEPAAIIRERLTRIGSALTHESEYAYRGTDWVARLSRTGKRVTKLATSVPIPSFDAVAQGANTSEWLTAELAHELDNTLRMLEDEWKLFT